MRTVNTQGGAMFDTGRKPQWLGAAALLAAMPVMAETPEEFELAGRITGLLAGEEREWHILRQGTDSHATFTDQGEHYTIDLTGFVEPDRIEHLDSLSLSITLVDGEVTALDVLHPIGTSPMPPVFTSDGGDVRLELKAFSVEGTVARVAGRLEGSLALQKSLEDAPTLDEGIDISVAFDAEASRIEY
ncbi:hypothetical protein F0A17_05725 [Billgrantia pellis]|uniref:YceI family protein n=1 Tax=Billgrantia pellis TaxID=2606936 RepID=A0A7V7G1Z4_9GAMM|nr:hypothetical protein [Halomonas pellis]KAA0013840.1 hypothetical protein F0A17_05725 [Halomonas pellis]